MVEVNYSKLKDSIINYGSNILSPEWYISQLKGRENYDNFIGYNRCAVNIVTEEF